MTVPGADQPSRSARAAVEEVVAGLSAHVPELAEQVCEEVHTAVPELPATLRPDTLHLCHAHLTAATSMLAGGEAAERAPVPPEALAYARGFVRQGLPAELMGRMYRVGHAAFWRETLGALQAHVQSRDELAEAMAIASEWTFGYIDRMVQAVFVAYQEEHERWSRSSSALRLEEVRRVLSGQSGGEGEVSQRLNYELRRRHVALVLWDDGPGQDGRTLIALQQLAERLVKALGGVDALHAPLAAGTLSTWAGARDDLDHAAALAAFAAEHERHPTVHLAIGEQHEGLAGFRRSHTECLHAQRLAVLTRRPARAPLRYVDGALSAMLTTDLEEARHFVRRELGPLLDGRDSSRRLIATLKVFLEEGSSPARTARRLGVHENTVVYRVRKATEVLGRTAAQRQLETRVALQLAAVLERARAMPEDGGGSTGT